MLFTLLYRYFTVHLFSLPLIACRKMSLCLVVLTKQTHALSTSNESQCKSISKNIYCPILVEGVTPRPRYRPALCRSVSRADWAAPDSFR